MHFRRHTLTGTGLPIDHFIGDFCRVAAIHRVNMVCCGDAAP
ncbi:MAG: hypothetical protein AB9891_05660 [Anaerolineaceae bacterium]